MHALSPRPTVRARWALLLVLAVANAACASPPTTRSSMPDATASPARPDPADVDRCACAPAGTVVELEVMDALVSDERRAGEGFALRLAAPIVTDGVVLVPAGTPGRGEIVHAAKARGGGQPGEFILAARYLESGGQRIPLRGMKFGVAGTDRAGAALATAIAVGVFAQFIHGGEVRIPPGTRATARLAQRLDAAAALAPPGAAAPSDPATNAQPTTAPPHQE